MHTAIEKGAGAPALRLVASSPLVGLRTAAEAGDARAQYNLGVAYEEGRGVPSNTRQAVKWYRLAAQQDDADAQLALGVAYAIGEGVDRDYALAYVWFSQAARQGREEAVELLELVARELGKAGTAEARLESERVAATLTH